MSENQVARALRERGIRVATFARQIDMNQQTLYNVVKKESVDNISISIFIKIAEGLGMTAEELYYGTPPKPPQYSDHRQEALNGHYESLNEEGKSALVGFAKSFAADPERRIAKGRQDSGGEIEMGA